MKIAAIIPARFQSTRFKGKPLVKIGGVPMIERVYRQVEKSGMFSFQQIIVATDDARIAKIVSSFGGNVRMTSAHHQSGSERLWEVLEKSDFDAAINIQGDEPIISEIIIGSLYQELATGQTAVVTPAYFNTSYSDFLSRHVVKVVVDSQSRALYFSRSPIPFCEESQFKGFYHHQGMYGYLRESLQTFVKTPPSNLETLEKLEQLRFLEHGIPIKVIPSPYKSVGVDVPADVNEVERLLELMDQEK